MSRTTAKRRTFHGLQLEDAKVPLPIPVLQIDKKAADEALRDVGIDDPIRYKNCIVAKACTRVFGDEINVAILRKTAYIALDAEKRALRFEIAPGTREIVEAFDRGKKIKTGTIVMLRPPSEHRKLPAMRRYWKENNHKYGRQTGRVQRRSDPLEAVVRNGNLVKIV